MLAVSFFFVLAGGSLLFIGLVAIFLYYLGLQGTNQEGRLKKWLMLASVGLVSLILGLLIAMT